MSTNYTFLGHGTQMIETNGYTVIIDPFFDDNPAASKTANEVDADFILVSHGHGDHIMDAASIAKRTKSLVISNGEICDWLLTQGAPLTHDQNIGGGHQHPFGHIKFTNALHSSPLPDGSYGGNPMGILFTSSTGQKIYLACDTALFGDMQLIGDEGIDLAVLPIGDNYTMGPDDAVKAIKLIRPKHVIPVHYNTWPLLAQDDTAWAEKVIAQTKAIPHILQPGESFKL
jgi:L-ascorbate metabolism protein UlaG (beta-lactamase superfamily)